MISQFFSIMYAAIRTSLCGLFSTKSLWEEGLCQTLSRELSEPPYAFQCPVCCDLWPSGVACRSSLTVEAVLSIFLLELLSAFKGHVSFNVQFVHSCIRIMDSSHGLYILCHHQPLLTCLLLSKPRPAHKCCGCCWITPLKNFCGWMFNLKMYPAYLAVSVQHCIVHQTL